MATSTCYRFSEFVVSRQKRQLFRQEQPLPLIPRYFDLLVLLIERRHTAVSRREIFDLVWGDVIVSDGALSQAVRTLRRSLGDDPREPVFIRTVSRHGYSFVFPDVVEEQETKEAPQRQVAARTAEAGQPAIPLDEQIETLVDRLRGTGGAGRDEDRRDAAEQLHAIDTAAALARLVREPGHADALAIFRDARWAVAGAGPVPLIGQPEGFAAALALIRLRLREALRVTGRRWVQAAVGAAVAGIAAGLVGGALLVLAPQSAAPVTAVAVLAVLGALAGFVGAAGVAAGIAVAEALARSQRAAAILIGGALGGLAVGIVARAAVAWTLESLFGLMVGVGGPVEGLCLGAAVALGYAATTSRHGGGIATPSGPARRRTAVAAAAAAGATAWLLASAGSPLVGGLINQVAQASRGSNVTLAPLGALVGEPSFGPIAQSLVGLFEGALFGFGLAWGLTRRRPHSISPAAHERLTSR